MLSDDDQITEDFSQVSNPPECPSNSSTRSAVLFPLVSSKSDQHRIRRADNNTSARKQPTSEDLARYGIKARDFFYESTLPPIRPVIHRQVQPGPSPRKRNHKGQELAYGDPDHRTKRIRTLERVPTELIGEDASQTNSRGLGPVAHQPLNQWRGSSRIPMSPNPPTHTPLRPNFSTSETESRLCDTTTALSISQFESQKSEIDALLFTPTSSFYLEAQTIQITNSPSSQPDPASQLRSAGDFTVSYSQLGFTRETSQAEESRHIHNPFPPSRLVRSNSSVLHSSSTRLPFQTSSSIRRPSSSHLSPTTSRYFLRQRTAISYFANTSSGRTKRGRSRGSASMKVTMHTPGKL